MTAPLIAEGGIYRPDGSAICRIGQTAVLELQLAEPGDTGPFTPADLSGRFFVQRLFDKAGAVLVEIEATRPDDLTVRFELTIEEAYLPGALAAADLTHAIVELLDDDQEDDVLIRPFSIRRLRSGLPIARFEIGAPDRLVVRYAGSKGASAAEEMKAAGLIDQATPDALAAYLGAPALEAAEAAEAERLATAAVRAQAEILVAGAAGSIQQAGAAQTVLVGQAGAAAVEVVEQAVAAQVADAVQVFAVRDFPTTSAALSNGVVSLASVVPGTGGTNGTFALAFSGGGGQDAAGVFVVAGGVIVSAQITYGGHGYTSAPAVSFAASAGLTGASATAVIAQNRPPGSFFRIATAQGFESFQNIAGVATSTGVYVKSEVGPGSPEVSYPDVNLLVRPFTMAHPEIDAMKAAAAAGAIAGENLKVGPGSPEVDLKRVGLVVRPTTMTHPQLTVDRARMARLEAARAVVPDPAQAPVLAAAQLLHFITLTQSLGRGWASTAISTTPTPGGKMFVNGVRTSDGTGTAAQRRASLVDLVEQTVNPGTSLGETLASGAVAMIVQLLEAEGITLADLDQALLMSSCGDGSKSAAQLANGGAYFQELKDDITYGRARADALGKAYDVANVVYGEGEQDYFLNTDPAVYDAIVTGIQADAEAHYQATVGTTRPLPFLMYQTPTHLAYGRATPTIALRQVLMAQRTFWGLIPPIYHLPFVDTVHPTAPGYRWLGAMVGRMSFDWLFKSYKAPPMVPTQVRAVGNALIARFPVRPGCRLVFDRSQVAPQTAEGLSIRTAGGTVVPPIDVKIIGAGDTIAVVSASARSPGDRLCPAWTGDGNKGLTNICDNDSLVFDPAGSNRRMQTFLHISDEAAA